MVSPLFNSKKKPKSPVKNVFNNETLALKGLVELGPKVVVGEDHFGLWQFIARLVQDQEPIRFPQNRVPELWKTSPPEVWIIPPAKTSSKQVVKAMTRLFESIGATVHEGAPSRFDRKDPI